MILFASLLTLIVWDLDTTDGAFVSSGSTGQWEWGVATVGPPGGETAWGTNLDGNHFNDATDALELPIPELGGATAPVLVLDHWYEIRAGDVGRVEVFDGLGWQPIEPVYGYPAVDGFVGRSNDWVTDTVLLDGLGPRPRIRLLLDADASVASSGWYVRQASVLDGDATPPLVEPLLLPEDTSDLAGPYAVVAHIDDETGVVAAMLEVSVDGGPSNDVPMSRQPDGSWLGEIDGAPSGSTVEFVIVASDHQNSTVWPPSGAASFEVSLPRPTGLAGPSGRVVGQAISLDWLAPTGEPPLSYLVFEQGSAAATEVTAPPASVSVDPDGDHVFTVAAVHADGVSAPSDPLSVDVTVPRLHAVTPAAALQGDTLYIDVQGDALFAVDGLTELDLGDGVEVRDLVVADVGHLTAVVHVAPDAAKGARPVEVVGAYGRASFAGAFVIGDGDARPRILSITPERVVQGSTVSIEIAAPFDFAGPVSVDPGPGLLVTSDVQVDGELARFDLLALGNAAPGERLLVLDDGTRLWTAAIEVREYVVTGRRCGTAPIPAAWVGLILLPLLTRRRRPFC